MKFKKKLPLTKLAYRRRKPELQHLPSEKYLSVKHIALTMNVVQFASK